MKKYEEMERYYPKKIKGNKDLWIIWDKLTNKKSSMCCFKSYADEKTAKDSIRYYITGEGLDEYLKDKTEGKVYG